MICVEVFQNKRTNLTTRFFMTLLLPNESIAIWGILPPAKRRTVSKRASGNQLAKATDLWWTRYRRSH